ncbi:DUF6140 family protein [Sphingobacterium sp. xlx-130]|uniref:DUF6140 family protein n=1 Tax=Sphingobacterium sp. xlx-130 TaxID=2654323 RepID=UPI0013DADDE6|nr:DUF6140 family protein [Sphingobacterium sp. xlx-130]
MPLFILTLTQRKAANGVILEKGMSVEVVAFLESDIYANGGGKLADAFMRTYGIDIKPLGGAQSVRPYLQVTKV